mmetsp:Transcript_139546/g.347994  ORF Transcript_139546/g.347994 Transcript_139546/m.347994 type:complete len:266 (+) Transcript_139546:359-1156(+)
MVGYTQECPELGVFDAHGPLGLLDRSLQGLAQRRIVPAQGIRFGLSLLKLRKGVVLLFAGLDGVAYAVRVRPVHAAQVVCQLLTEFMQVVHLRLQLRRRAHAGGAAITAAATRRGVACHCRLRFCRGTASAVTDVALRLIFLVQQLCHKTCNRRRKGCHWANAWRGAHVGGAHLRRRHLLPPLAPAEGGRLQVAVPGHQIPCDILLRSGERSFHEGLAELLGRVLRQALTAAAATHCGECQASAGGRWHRGFPRRQCRSRYGSSG